MDKRLRVDYAQSARDDLSEIISWYAPKQVPEVGVRLVGEILRRTEQLSVFPDSGRAVPEFEITWLRELEHPPFRIVYRRDESAVTVVRVWRSERLIDPELGSDA